VTVGGVLQQALGLYQRFFWRFVATTAIVFIVLDLLSALAWSAGSGGGRVITVLVSAIVGFVGTFLVQGALTLAVDDVRDGRIDSPISELYARTRPHLGALIIAGVLAAIGISIGLVLLILPGLYLLTRWAVIVPSIMLEGKSAGESFGRSNELTSGHRWSVLGVAIVTFLASAVLSSIVSSIFRAVLPEFLGVWLGDFVAHCVTTPFLALAWTVMYFDLRRAAEPPPAAVEPPAATV
jgi:hypothetical protein